MAEENTQVKAQPANFGDAVVGEVELPKIDVSPFVGTDAKIELIEEFVGLHGPYVKVSTGIVHTVTREGKDPIELRASRIFGLVEVEQDGKKVIGWGGESKLAGYLKVKGLKHYRDMKGMDIKIQSQISNGVEFLTI